MQQEVTLSTNHATREHPGDELELAVEDAKTRLRSRGGRCHLLRGMGVPTGLHPAKAASDPTQQLLQPSPATWQGLSWRNKLSGQPTASRNRSGSAVLDEPTGPLGGRLLAKSLGQLANLGFWIAAVTAHGP